MFLRGQDEIGVYPVRIPFPGKLSDCAAGRGSESEINCGVREKIIPLYETCCFECVREREDLLAQTLVVQVNLLRIKPTWSWNPDDFVNGHML